MSTSILSDAVQVPARDSREMHPQEAPNAATHNEDEDLLGARRMGKVASGGQVIRKRIIHRYISVLPQMAPGLLVRKGLAIPQGACKYTSVGMGALHEPVQRPRQPVAPVFKAGTGPTPRATGPSAHVWTAPKCARVYVRPTSETPRETPCQTHSTRLESSAGGAPAASSIGHAPTWSNSGSGLSVPSIPTNTLAHLAPQSGRARSLSQPRQPPTHKYSYFAEKRASRFVFRATSVSKKPATEPTIPLQPVSSSAAVAGSVTVGQQTTVASNLAQSAPNCDLVCSKQTPINAPSAAQEPCSLPFTKQVSALSPTKQEVHTMSLATRINVTNPLPVAIQQINATSPLPVETLQISPVSLTGPAIAHNMTAMTPVPVPTAASTVAAGSTLPVRGRAPTRASWAHPVRSGGVRCLDVSRASNAWQSSNRVYLCRPPTPGISTRGRGGGTGGSVPPFAARTGANRFRWQRT